jgi:hypothetical protein
MRKLIIITTGILLINLTSCYKETIIDCREAKTNYGQEVLRAGQNTQQISLITQKYKEKYPNCEF